MIRTIREKLSILMWFVVAAFVATIIFSWGMGGIKKTDPRAEGNIAKINGVDVKYVELKNIEESYLKNSKDKELSGVKVAELKKKAWKDFVKMIVIRQELEKQDITISSEQVYNEILNNPLPELKGSDQFKTDGVFDDKKYQDFIKNPKPEYAEFYKAIESAYENRMPGQMLEKRVGNSVYISDFELMNQYKETNLKAKVKFLKAEGNKLQPADSTITDKEIEDYFNTHSYEFPNYKEKRNFDYILFSTAPTANDSARVLEDINYALDKVKSGIPFDQVAKNYSEDTSASNGGDLGFFGKGKMAPEFEKAAFEAEIGDIVGPVKTKYGYHIIKVEHKKTEGDEVTEVKASHILVKFKTHKETYDDAEYAAMNFIEEIRKLGDDQKAFKTAAVNLGHKVIEAPFTTETDRTNELGIIPGLGDFLFNNEIGTRSSLMVCDKGYVYIQIKEIQPERAKTLEEVKSRIIYNIKNEKGLDKALAKMIEVKESVTDTLAMNSIAEKEEAFLTGTSNNFYVNVYIDKVGVDREMYEQAMSLNVGQMSEPFKGEQGAYIIYLIKKDEFDQAKYDAEKKEFREKQESYLKRQMVQEWLEGLVEQADVEDLRKLYYR